MLYLVGFLVFCLVFTLLYSILYMSNKDKMMMKSRMEEVRDIEKIRLNEEHEKSFSQRAMEPISESIGKVLRKLSPGHRVNKVNKKLECAGLSNKITYERLAVYNVSGSIFAASLFGGVTRLGEFTIVKFLVFAAFGIIGVQIIIRFYIESKITKKGKSIVRDLPFTLDLITVSVEAGLSFDGAIARVINNIDGGLSDEFAKTLKEMKMGIERKIALRNMSERNNIKELSMLITSLIQADSLGVSLGNVLRIESEQLRETRKQIAREKAMKAPVKMLFPLIIFIFPAIFVVILGPAVIQMAEMFMGK